jgi:pimeloyl-ACP methyl ester carboxylesterase
MGVDWLLSRALLAAAFFAASGVNAREGEIRANGLSFHYVDEGSGPPVLLVHGSIADYREWSRQIAPLSQHYRVIVYSRRYHWPRRGKTPMRRSTARPTTSRRSSVRWGLLQCTSSAIPTEGPPHSSLL